MNRRSRHAFTLIELLTVIAIMGILMALLLPAVMKVRAAAARVQCANNLKQIGIALHGFNSDRSFFPPGFKGTALTTNGATNAYGWGWGAYLLPYLEQDTLFRLINFKKSITPLAADPDYADIVTARETSVKSFLCPSDNPVNLKITVYDGASPAVAICDVAFANYVAMSGVHEVSTYPDTGFPDTPLGSGTYVLPTPDPRGTFLRSAKDRGIKAADMADGTAATMLVTERAWLWQGAQRSQMTTWVGAVPGAVPGTGETEASLVLTNSGTLAEARTPNTKNWGNHFEDANSNHTGSVNCLFGDGSVRSVPTTVDTALWIAITTRSGRDTVDFDF